MIITVDGKPAKVTSTGGKTQIVIDGTKASNIVAVSQNTNATDDIHTQYPVGMKVYILKFDADTGTYTAEYVPEFDNLLQYAGSSIRYTSNKGIRMITAIDKDKKAALVNKMGLAGFTVKEYGTVLCRSSLMVGGSLTLEDSYAKHNYAYNKAMGADPIFNSTSTTIQYTNVLVGFTLDDCKDDIAMRPYMILTDKDGNDITIYGGIVYRSIGYIAYQNRNAFKPGNAAYDYIWEIIHHVYGTRYDEK